MSGHELALVSVEVLRLLDESLSLAQLIGRLIERNVAGVVVVGVVDPTAIDRAERANLPLLQLADGYQFTDLGPTLSRIIAEQRTVLYQLSLDLHHQLAEVSMAGRGLKGIVARLSDLTGRSIILQDVSGAILVQDARASATEEGGEASSDVPAVAVLRDRFVGAIAGRTEPPITRVTLRSGIGLVSPVVVRDVVVGYLTVRGATDDFSDADQVSLTRGSVVCALELAKQEAVTEAERRLRGGFFDDLLGGPMQGDDVETLQGRASHLGYDLRRPYVALVIAPDDPGERGEGSSLDGERLVREVTQYLANRRVAGMVTLRRQNVALFFVSESPLDASLSHRFAEGLRDYLAGPIEIPVSIGIGRYHAGVAGLRPAYLEAEQASQIGREFFGPGQVVAYGDLGVYRLLYAFRQSGELSTFCQETLAPLIDYDAKNGTELIETLEAYFRSDASLGNAAAALFLHRNSLSYRLRRISELTGMDLDNLEDRFQLQLALKGYRLVKSEVTA